MWSDLYGENFFGMEGKWCAENHVEMQTHIEHEENLPNLAGAEGDFFKCMRGLQIPGIDTIQHQIWHDVVADFPKLASSATHLNGHPRAMCEAFAAYNPVPDLKEAGWILNHLLVQGINRIEYMGLQGTGPCRGFYGDPGFPAVSAHVNRLATCWAKAAPPRKSASISLPAVSGSTTPPRTPPSSPSSTNCSSISATSTTWMNTRCRKRSSCRARNWSTRAARRYRAILIPPVDAISKAALDNLRAFAKAGGKVIFFGNAPKLVMDKNFLTATGPADISWATLEPAREITAQVLAALPAPDVATDQATLWLKYNHRRMKDADLYFFFNEGEQPLSLKATVANSGTARQAQQWDTTTGKIEPWAGATFADGKTTLPLELQPWATTIVVVGSNVTPPSELKCQNSKR